MLGFYVAYPYWKQALVLIFSFQIMDNNLFLELEDGDSAAINGGGVMMQGFSGGGGWGFTGPLGYVSTSGCYSYSFPGGIGAEGVISVGCKTIPFSFGKGR